jgi:non-specific serine/threonine protein kinase
MKPLNFLIIGLISLTSCEKPSIDEYYKEIENISDKEGQYRPIKDGVVIESGPVDLGLSVKWSARNLDANTTDHFAYSNLDDGTKFNGNEYNWSRGVSIYEVGGTKYDNATRLLGKRWKTPSNNEFLELNKCKISWTSYKGVDGVIVTGTTGNAIFIPIDEYKTYWTSSYFSSSGDIPYRPVYCYFVNRDVPEFMADYYDEDNSEKYIRPVYTGK